MSYRIDPRLPLTGEVRRIAAEEIGRALAHLDGRARRPDKALHKCRKRLKSCARLLRLVRSGDESVLPSRERSATARWRRGLPARARRPR